MIPLIVITGPTGSGKTDVAIRMAEQYGGEIVCADSRTVYKYLNIGTAKPTEPEKARVPHHLLDIVEPDEQYNLARFQHDALQVIQDIRSRGKIPFLVGGSGLYIDSVVLEYELGQEPNKELRDSLEAKTIDELFQYCIENNINLPDNLYNKRYVIRAIEQNGINNTRRNEPVETTTVIGIKTDPELLKQRLQQRARSMYNAGLLEETIRVSKKYGWDVSPLNTPEYLISRRLLDNEITQQQAVELVAKGDWQLARKQMTWMRRNKWIEWTELEHVETAVHSILAHVVL